MKFGRTALLMGLAGILLAACAARRSDLAAWNPPPYFAQEKYAEVEGMRIAYLETGENNPVAVVFVHGFSGDVQNWWDQFDYFQS